MIESEDIIRIVERELDMTPGEVGAESTADDVRNWDSLGHVRVCMAVESEFGVTIDLDAMESVKSIPGLLAFVQAHAA